MPQGYSGPRVKDLRTNLARLIADGIVPYNVADNGGDLLNLQIVTSRLRVDEVADEDEVDAAYADALLEVLRDAVRKHRIPSRKHRVILRYVLPLKDEYRGADIRRRRTAAGESLTDGKRVVKPNTIRTYREYEPRALDELARALVEMEAEHRGERLSQAASDA